MDNSKNYNIDYATKSIIITKKFQKEASNITSAAYRTMRQIMNDFPTFEVKCKEIKKKSGKLTYKGLTKDEMLRFLLDTYGKDSENVEKFEKVIEIAKNKSGSYATIKKFFLDNYKDAYSKEIEAFNTKETENTEFDNNNNAA